jgi:hypothetical protein
MSASRRSQHRVLLSAAIALLVAVVLAQSAPAASAADTAKSKELKLKTEIVSATVYGRQAQIVRRGEVKLEPGAVALVCADLPEKAIESSLSVEGRGLTGARIIGIDLRRRQTTEVDSPRYKELMEKLDGLDATFASLQNRHGALSRRKELTRSISDFTSGVGSDEMKEGKFAPGYWEGVLKFFETEDIGNADRTDELENEMREVESERARIRDELRKMQIGEGPGTDVDVDCEADAGGTLTVELTYLVPDATWYPEYTVRYVEPDAEVELTYAARIAQATGEDWKGVSVLLSTATPHVGAAPPELVPLLVGGTTGTIRGRVTDSATGRALPFANISVVGTAYGNITNKDGVYTISDVPAGTYRLQVSYMGFATARLSDVRVRVGTVTRADVALNPEAILAEEVLIEAERPMVDMGTVTAKTAGTGELHVRGGRATEEKTPDIPPLIPQIEAEVLGSEYAANLVIPRPVDLETGAEPRRSLVARQRIPGSFVLEAVPCLSEHVFVKGTLSNPLAFPLLPGSAETYVETVPKGSKSSVSNFVGNDRIDAVASGEEFEMFLGVDQNVKVEHTLKTKETLSRADSRTTKIKYVYVIKAESFRSAPAELHVEDRIPVSTIKDIKIDDVRIEPEPDERTEDGLMKWKLSMEPGAAREMTIEYVVAYPSTMSAKNLGLED